MGDDGHFRTKFTAEHGNTLPSIPFPPICAGIASKTGNTALCGEAPVGFGLGFGLGLGSLLGLGLGLGVGS